jgi:hypothetical protein
MSGVRKIEVNERDLPMVLEVKGFNGKKESYSLNPAGKEKLGARLGDPKETLCKKGRM